VLGDETQGCRPSATLEQELFKEYKQQNIYRKSSTEKINNLTPFVESLLTHYQHTVNKSKTQNQETRGNRHNEYTTTLTIVLCWRNNTKEVR